jgi:hypothetical protein
VRYFPPEPLVTDRISPEDTVDDSFESLLDGTSDR